jgi:hypothetical protein
LENGGYACHKNAMLDYRSKNYNNGGCMQGKARGKGQENEASFVLEWMEDMQRMMGGSAENLRIKKQRKIVQRREFAQKDFGILFILRCLILVQRGGTV